MIGTSFRVGALPGVREKGEAAVSPKISICRKGDNIYLKLMGNFNPATAHQILHAVEKVLTASLKFASPGSKVFYTFRAHSRVSLGKQESPPPLLN